MLLYIAISKISCLLENVSPINLGFLKIACVIASSPEKHSLGGVRREETPLCLADKASRRISGSYSRSQAVRGLCTKVPHTFICAKQLQKEMLKFCMYVRLFPNLLFFLPCNICLKMLIPRIQLQSLY